MLRQEKRWGSISRSLDYDKGLQPLPYIPKQKQYTFNSTPAKPLLCMLNSGGFFFFLIGDIHNFENRVFYHRVPKCHVLVEEVETGDFQKTKTRSDAEVIKRAVENEC